MHKFSEDDVGYTGWIKDHPNGFVLNVRSAPSQSYAVLHRTSCRSISRVRDNGAHTGRGYRKVTADTVDELRHYLRSLDGDDGSFSATCSVCAPLST